MPMGGLPSSARMVDTRFMTNENCFCAHSGLSRSGELMQSCTSWRPSGTLNSWLTVAFLCLDADETFRLNADLPSTVTVTVPDSSLCSRMRLAEALLTGTGGGAAAC